MRLTATRASTTVSDFTPEHEMFRQTVRRFVDEEVNPHVDAWEAAGIYPAHDLLKKMAALDMLGLSYPEEDGGMDLDLWYSIVLWEELARIDCGGVPMGLTVHTDMCTPALAQHGSPELKKQFLEPALRGRFVGCLGVSEPEAGSDVAAIRTRAVADGDDWVIDGRKMWITNGTQADWVCLLARTSEGRDHKGLSLIMVPTDVPGFTVAGKISKIGNHSSDTGDLIFENVRVPRTNTVGAEGAGFILLMQQFQRERLVAAVMTYVQCEKIVRAAVDYTRARHTFGKPILSNQVVHFRFAEMLTEIELLKALCYSCARKMDAGLDITREASMAKLKAGRLVREVTDCCLQFYGGMGYSDELPISRAYRDARLISIGGGADEIMLGIIAKIEGFI